MEPNKSIAKETQIYLNLLKISQINQSTIFDRKVSKQIKKLE